MLQKLSIHAAFSALHDSDSRSQRPGVLEGTRESFIGELGKWIKNPVGRGRVYWVRGFYRSDGVGDVWLPSVQIYNLAQEYH